MSENVKKNNFLRICVITILMLLYLYITVYSAVPDKITMIEGKEISYPFHNFITMSLDAECSVKATGGKLVSSKVGKENVKLSLFGIIPLKNVDINVISANTVIAGGNVIGIKLNTPGLTVVSLESFVTRDYSKAKPYEGKNIQRGDIILSINGKEIESVDEFINELQVSKENKITLEIMRNNTKFNETFLAKIDRNDGKYKLGIWVKNVTSGVGTVTYINPENGEFGALGHGINDIDESSLLKINGGKAYDAVVLSVNKGKKGAPGEIRGAMREGSIFGSVTQNTTQGIFGYLTENVDMENKQYEIALKNEVVPGEAKILCTVSGNECKEYKIRIEKANYSNELDSKDMVIRVTDRKLLEETGGIVQGMSGSPIIQNGKIIGAVTHVLINDPTRGYGIFIENMLENAA